MCLFKNLNIQGLFFTNVLKGIKPNTTDGWSVNLNHS